MPKGKMTKSTKCITEGCLNVARALGPECKLCRAGELGWYNNKTPAQALERRRKLTMYNARINVVLRMRKAK